MHPSSLAQSKIATLWSSLATAGHAASNRQSSLLKTVPMTSLVFAADVTKWCVNIVAGSKYHHCDVTHVTQSPSVFGIQNHSVNSCSHSVNGDIAIQWEWSKFDPSQNPNPLTDYDKTLHNWLRPRDEHVTQNLCQSAVRERLAKYVKYKASLFLFLFPGLAYWSNPCMEFHARCLKTRVVT